MSSYISESGKNNFKNEPGLSPRRIKRDVYISLGVFLFISFIFFIFTGDLMGMVLINLSVLFTIKMGVLLFQIPNRIALFVTFPAAIIFFHFGFIVIDKISNIYSGDMGVIGAALFYYPGIFSISIYSMIYTKVLYDRKNS
jgi:hypothetical protein